MSALGLEKRRNARDFGGLTNKAGRTIRPNLFLRTGKLDDLSEEEITLLSDVCSLKRILDLRMEMETQSKPDSEVPGAQWIPMRIINESVAGITREDRVEDEVRRLAGTPYMPHFYAMLVENEHCIRMLGETLRLIMQPVEGATLWHCSEGKDRCGLVSALFLYLLDVEESVIMEDYLRTNEVSIPRAQALKDHVLALGADEETADKIFWSYQAREDYLQAAIDSICRRFGSVEVFLRDGLGISDAEKQAFQDRVLE